MYRVFVRNWWRETSDSAWPDGLEPDPTARKTTLQKNIHTEEEAQQICKRYNDAHKPGRLSRKAEYTEQ